MNATTLKALYEAQLEEDLQPPVDPDVDRRGTRGMLRVSRRLPAGDLVEANCGRIWVWSDLHLGHSTSIGSFARPFESTREADDAFFRNWHRTVGPGDTIICLGDVAIGGLSGTRLRRLRSAPGRKIVVIGNHEINAVGELEIDGFDEIGVWGAMERKVRLATAVSGVSERPELAPSDRFRYGERVASQQVDVLVAER